MANKNKIKVTTPKCIVMSGTAYRTANAAAQRYAWISTAINRKKRTEAADKFWAKHDPIAHSCPNYPGDARYGRIAVVTRRVFPIFFKYLGR